MGSADEPESKPKTMHKLKCKITNKAKSLFTKNKTKSETNAEQKPDAPTTRTALMEDKREPKMKSLTPTGISDSLEKTKMILLEKKQQQSLEKKETAPDSPKSDQFIIQRVSRKKVESDSFDDDDEFVFMDVKPKTNSQSSTDSGFGGASFDKDDIFEVVKEEKSNELIKDDEKANGLAKDDENSIQLVKDDEKTNELIKDGEKSVKDDKKSKEHIEQDERTKDNVKSNENSVDPLTESLNKLEISTDKTEKSVTDALKKLTIDVDKSKEDEKGDKKKKHKVLITRGPVRHKDFKTPTGPYSQQINQVNERIFSGGHVIVQETHQADAKSSIYQLEQPALPTFFAGAASHAPRYEAAPLDEIETPLLNATGLTNKEVEDCINQVFAVLPNEVIDTLLESQPTLQNPNFDGQWTAINQQTNASNLMSLYEAELNAQNPSPESIQSYSSSPPQILAHEISHDFFTHDFMPVLSASPTYAKSPPADADLLNDYAQQIIKASPSYSSSSHSNDGLNARVFDGLSDFDGAHNFDSAFDGAQNVFKDFNSQNAMLSEDFLLAFNHNTLGADMLTPPRSNDSHCPPSPFASPKYAESYAHSSPRSDDYVMSPSNRTEQTYIFASASPEHDRTTPTIKLTDAAVKIDEESDADDSKLKRRAPFNMSMFKKHMQVLAARYAAMQCCQKDRKHPKDAFVERLDRCTKEKRIQMTLRVGKLNIDQLFNLLYFRVLPALEGAPSSASDDVDYALVALICQRLLAEKPDLFLDEDFGLALLSRAAVRCAARPEITRYLVWCARRALACAPAAAARPAAVFTQTDVTGDNIAGALARLGDTHADCLAELVARDPRDRPLLDLEHRNTEGYSALHLACQLHSARAGPQTTRIVHVLLAHGGVPVTLPDNKAGDTALHCAVDAAGCDLDLVLTLFQDVPANRRRALAYCKNAGASSLSHRDVRQGQHSLRDCLFLKLDTHYLLPGSYKNTDRARPQRVPHSSRLSR